MHVFLPNVVIYAQGRSYKLDVCYSHLFATCTCLLLTWGQTQTQLDALKKKNEMAENELRASRTRAQQLAARNEDMAVS